MHIVVSVKLSHKLTVMVLFFYSLFSTSLTVVSHVNTNPRFTAIHDVYCAANWLAHCYWHRSSFTLSSLTIQTNIPHLWYGSNLDLVAENIHEESWSRNVAFLFIVESLSWCLSNARSSPVPHHGKLLCQLNGHSNSFETRPNKLLAKP